MKKLLVLSIAVLTLNAHAKMEETRPVKYSGDLDYSSFCESVVKDDVNILKLGVSRKVGVIAFNKRDVLKKLIAAEGMTCNGLDLISFAQQRKASAVTQYLSNL